MNKLILALATLLHLIPHPFGASTVGATALYAGAFGDKRTSWLVPWIPLTLAALIGGFYDPLIMAFVFGGFSLSALIGRWLLARRRGAARYGAAVACGALTFFLVSNFGMWLAGGYYPLTASGLALCYLNGLPYLGIAVLADACYSVVLFGLHALLERRHDRTVAA